MAAITDISRALINRRVAEGKPFPLGATCTADGVNFSVYSKNGTGVELLLFDRPDDPHPSYSIPLDPSTHQTYYYWHVFVPGLRAGRIYGYRVTHRFVKLLGAHRLHHLDRTNRRDQTLSDFLSEAHIQMHGTKLNQPDWGHDSHSLAFTARDPAGGMLHVIINGYWEPLAFEIPSTENGRWRRWIDTFLVSPDDICARNEAPLITGPTYLVQSRSR